MSSSDRIYLNVPFEHKDQVKRLGARWDNETRGWWISKHGDLLAFREWLPRMYRPNSPTPHITSEMIPQSTWYTNLRSLLPNDEWDALRKKCYSDAGYRCQVCGQKGDKWPVECNEQWEYQHNDDNPKLGIQKLVRLAALCPTCHSIKHLGKSNIDGKLNETLSQLAFVNGWTQEKCQDHADKAFSLWEERNEMSWTIDVSALKGYGIKSIQLDLNQDHEITDIIGIPLNYSGYRNIFNSSASILLPKKELVAASAQFWPNNSWVQSSPCSPFWFVDLTNTKGQVFRVWDCTINGYVTDSSLDKLQQNIQTCSFKGIVSLLIASRNESEVYDWLYETTNAMHPNYLCVCFDEEDFSQIFYGFEDNVCLKTEAFFKSIYTSLEYKGWDDHQEICGIEYIKTNCSACHYEHYRFTGLVIPNMVVKDWKNDPWQYIKHILPSSISEQLKSHVIESVNEHSSINNLPTSSLDNDLIPCCPQCNSKSIMGFRGDENRFSALMYDDAREERLMYHPIRIIIDHQTMHNSTNWEGVMYAVSPDFLPDWEF